MLSKFFQTKLSNIKTRVINGFFSIFFPNNLFTYKRELYNHHNLSFSQEGEDQILKRFLEKNKKGFYVDVGAHHPQRFSNTYAFYLMGWHGINIDAMPRSMNLFKKLRPRDINLEIGISNTEDILTYYIFNEPALNTFSEELAKTRPSPPYFVTETVSVPTATLTNILNKHLPKDQHIDFMSIDVEGLDLAVLQSNDWEKYSPDFILVEQLNEDIFAHSLDKVLNSTTAHYLKNKNYSLVAKSFNTLIFKHLKQR